MRLLLAVATYALQCASAVDLVEPLSGNELHQRGLETQHVDQMLASLASELQGKNDNGGNHNSMQKDFACGDIVATFSGAEVINHIVSMLGIDLAPRILPYFSTLFRLNDVEVRKICASCDSVKNMSGFDQAYGTNQNYDKYCGSEAYGHDVIHSGLVIYPTESNKLKTGRMPVFVNSRGTVVNTDKVPSGLGVSSFEAIFGLIATSVAGMVSILPDFMGYGESSKFIDRAYLIRNAYLTATLPLWIKAKSDMIDESEGRSSLARAGVFAGYSEGGYASAALSDGFSKSIGMEIIKTFAAGAPFRLSSAQPMTGLEKFDNGEDKAIYRFMYILFGSSYSSTYPGVANYNTNQDLLATEFTDPSNPQQNVLTWLKEEGIDAKTLLSRIPENWPSLLNPDIVKFFRDAIDNNVKNPCESKNLSLTVNKLCEALLENDLTDMLEAANYDIHICHSPFDDLVDFTNIPDFSRNPDHLSFSLSYGDHVGGIGVYALELMIFLNWENQFEYSCDVEGELLDRTILVPSTSACWKIELFESGIFAADYSNPHCLNDEYLPEELSVFSFASANKASFSKGPIGWSGEFVFKESPNLRKEKVLVKNWDEMSREFEIEIIFPACPTV